MSAAETAAPAASGLDAGGGILRALCAQIAPPRAAPIALVGEVERVEGHPLVGELLSWVEQLERFELELCDPALVELRAPGTISSLDGLLRLSGPAWIADFIGQLCAASVVFQQDELSYLASWAATVGGACPVYSFHPADWGLWPSDPSIAARLFRILDADRLMDPALGPLFSAPEAEPALDWGALADRLNTKEAPPRLPAHLDPARLFPRTDWLVHALLGVAGGPPLELSLKLAAPFSAYEEERPQLSAWPHLSLYWLWSHFFFGNTAALRDAIQLAGGCEAPLVSESARRIERLLAGDEVQIGPHRAEAILAWRARITRMALPEQLAPAERWRADQGPSEDQLREAETLARLRLEVAEDPPAQDTLAALEERLSKTEARPRRADLDALADRLDARFTPLILRRLARALSVEDGDPEAGAGLLIAWAALSEDLAQFEAQLARHGTERLGPRRLAELYWAYDRFDSPRATEQLARGAAAWLKEVEDWIRMTPDAPVYALLSRDSLPTHRFIAALLERASFSAANWEVCLAAARAAERLRSRRAAAGLRRAVEAGLGNLEDGSRLDVVRALLTAEGEAALPWLAERFEAAAKAWVSGGEEAEDSIYKLAPLLYGLFQLDPESERYQRVGRALLDSLRAQLPAGRPPPLKRLAAARALISGVRAGEVSALKDALQPWATLSFERTPSTGALARAIEAEVEAALGEL